MQADTAARLSRAVRMRGHMLAVGVGLITALGHAPFGLWPLTLIGLAVAGLLLHRSAGVRAAAVLGWSVGLGYFALTLSWIVEPFLVDIARHGWMAPFALVLLAGGLALFWALGFGLARRIGGPLALALTLPLAELLRAYVFTGFPWGMIAHVWVGHAPAQVASVLGAHGLNVLTLSVTGAAALALAGRRVFAVVACVGMAGFWAAGLALMPERGEDTAPRPVVRLIQPNAEQHLKWREDMVLVFFDRQRLLTSAPPGPLGPPDLIVWPETSVPYLLGSAGPALAAVAEAAGDIPVVVGVQRRAGEAFHNSLAVVGPGGAVEQVYDKHHLVPFGEYMPGGALSRRLGLTGLADRLGSGYAAGPGPQTLDLGRLGQALALICYEAIFPQWINNTPERPDWLLQITNDAWFGTVSGPYQHLDQARLRAIEQRLPLVRAANTGVSALVDIDGSIIDELPLGTAGYLDVALPPPGAPTLYVRSGDLPLAGFLLLLSLALWLRMRRKAD